MTIRRLVSQWAHAIQRQRVRPLDEEIMARTRIDPSDESAAASQAKGDLAKIFFEHRGRMLWKWIHYLEIYERHFAPYRNKPVTMLEIGVFKGGSLEMWREYFGQAAIIFGIDKNPDFAGNVIAPNQVRIGSQDDPMFLQKVISEMGSPDIILDDGSHVGRHQRTSFEILFPRLGPGGLYVLEDLHTSYWPPFEGGYQRKGTAIEHIKQMIDDMHAWYHHQPLKTPAKTDIGAIHLYDSIVVIEKRHREQPAHLQVGS